MSKLNKIASADLLLTIAVIAAFALDLCPTTAYAKPAPKAAHSGVIFDFENGTQGWNGKGISFSQAAAGTTSGKHSLKVANYNGAFAWIGSDKAGGSAARALHDASAVYFDVTFTSNVTLKKDKGGSQWFSFIVAAIGSDGKWNQAKGAAALPVTNGVIKAGTYPLQIPLTGMSRPASSSATLTFNLGPNSSGLAKPITFYIDSIRTAK